MPSDRIERFLDRWRDGWDDHDHDDPVLPRPTTHVQGIDWTRVQRAHDETGYGRV